MEGGEPKGSRGTLLIVLGALTIVAGLFVLAFARIALLAQLLLVAVGMAVIGVTKRVAAARAGHAALPLRMAGFVVGSLFLLFAGLALLAPSLGFALVVLMLVGGLMIYGAERVGIGVSSTLPRGERLFSVAFGSAGIVLAVGMLVVPGLAGVVATAVVAVLLFASGLGFILSGVRQRRFGVGPTPEARVTSVAAASPKSAHGRTPEQRLHCFVVASREEIIASLGRLMRKAKPKVQQGGLQAARKSNLKEDDLFRLLGAYAERQGDLTPWGGAGWDEIDATFERFKMRANLKFQWVRPVGSLTSKARIARVGYALRQTPLDLASTRRHGLAPIGIGAMGAGLTHVVAAFREAPGRVPKQLMERIEAEFGLLQGGLRAYGAYILHIVGAPADVDSDHLGDLFADHVPLLWDFGASHTEVGALDPSDHLLSATTNFLLGPAILFQHFYTEGRPVAFARTGDLVQVSWAGRRRVVHRSEALDVEKGFKRGDVTVPSPVLRAVDGPVLPSGRLEVRGLRSGGPALDQPGAGQPLAAVGVTSYDLREAGIKRLDWNLVIMMMEGEFVGRAPAGKDS